MLEKGKISALQMAILLYPLVVATADLALPAITYRFAERDMWLSPIWASCTGVFVLYLAVQLNKIYPQESLIQYLPHIIGRAFGKALGLIYLFYYLHVNGLVIRQYAEFIIGSFLSTTPLIVVSGSMVLVCALAVRGGLEVIARAAQFFVPLMLLFQFSLFLLLIPHLELKNAFPLLEKGLAPSLMGAVVPLGWFSHLFLLPFILPFLSDRKQGMKWGLIAVGFIMSMLLIIDLFTLLLFGGISGSLTYPMMEATRYISVADFLEHLESVVMALWVLGAFLKISLFYYILTLGSAQWMGVSDYKPLTFPTGMLLVLFSIWSADSQPDISHYLSTSSPFLATTVQILIPALLLFIARWRRGNAPR